MTARIRPAYTGPSPVAELVPSPVGLLVAELVPSPVAEFVPIPGMNDSPDSARIHRAKSGCRN